MASKKKQNKSQNKMGLGAVIGIVLVLMIVFVVGMVALINNKKAESTAVQKTETVEEKTDTSTVNGPVVEIKVKDYGTIRVQLDEETAPITVENFVKLVNDKFYDGLTFHRIIDGFMIQGGDPLGNGTGGSDKTIKGEFSSNGIENDISHKRGVISMARANDPDSASSQFFIVQADSEFLDGDYAAFGYVLDGMDVVDAICKDIQVEDNNGTVLAENQPIIEMITAN